MATTTVTFRIDDGLKKEADDLFNDLGLSFTAALTAFISQAVREQRIPFSLSRNVPNEETFRALQEALRGEGLSRPFHSVDELFADLDADS